MKKRRIAAVAMFALLLIVLGACGSKREDAPATEETWMQQAPEQTAPADTAQPTATIQTQPETE